MYSHQKILLASIGLSSAMWIVPFLWFLWLPLIYLNTHIHELAHALTALATGGQVQHILVFANGGGVTPVMGGSILLIASAGYVGSTLTGAAMLLQSKSADGARKALMLAGFILLFSLIFFVRGDLIGVLTGIGWTVFLFASGAKMSAKWATFFARFLGVALCLASLEAYKYLFASTMVPDAHSDAAIMQSVTGVPAVVWATAWFVFSLVVLVPTLKSAWRGNAKPKPASS